ncbi:minichromosome maintenance protein MCM [Candidatus Woesearchaeota archaeon]|nr:minichromosome maintenance protein MCM [Candidatus Woesearchaeota archaeon]
MISSVSEQIEKFQGFFEQEFKNELNEVISGEVKSLQVDFLKLTVFDMELAEMLLENPKDLIRAGELALNNIDGLEEKQLRLRLFNLPKAQQKEIRDIRSKHLGKFISFRGLIKQASDVRPQVVSAKFECPSCGNTINILQVDVKFKEPSRCSCGRRGSFRILSKELVDAQRIVIEESPDALEGGSQPKKLAAFLREDLVDPKMEKRTTPGSKVEVCGIIVEIPVPDKSGGLTTRFDIVMEANNIIPLEQDYSDISVSEEDKKEIIGLSKAPNLMQKFINSIAPSIYGHENVKKALVLQLMGGVKKERADGTRTRGDFHILLIGDPGCGKSQLLKFIGAAAPRARYVSGKSASGAGLTAAVVKDEFIRGWSLEAGAMPLANKGICVIDEMDKMSKEDTSALHEAMEMQTITVSKANIQATLRTETTVLAAANPKNSRFNPYQTLATQIDMPSTLLDRFDLIFPVKDQPTKEKDTLIANHILEMQTSKAKEPEINAKLLRKYISYVKQNINPELTDEAKEEIRSFYVNLRNTTPNGEDEIRSIPITARQLEGLIRLSEAAARLRLSGKITKADARTAIELTTYCLMEIGLDPETKELDIDRIGSGTSASERRKKAVAQLIIEIIDGLAKSGMKTIPIADIFGKAAEKSITEDKVLEVVEQMKRNGDIFEPKQGYIEKI